MHCCVSMSVGQALPPCMGATTTLRVRSCVPPPLDKEHAPQLVHGVTSQLSGQGLVLHGWVWSVSPHAAPPHAASCRTARVRVLVPLPHALEHGSQLPHRDCAQSIGQHMVLQGCDWDRTGHEVPPCRAGMWMERVRCCTPPPHVLSHASQAPKSVTVQSTGQGCVLHGRSSVNAPQATPPHAAT